MMPLVQLPYGFASWLPEATFIRRIYWSAQVKEAQHLQIQATIAYYLVPTNIRTFEYFETEASNQEKLKVFYTYKSSHVLFYLDDSLSCIW
jgi:hypothetical protein